MQSVVLKQRESGVSLELAIQLGSKKHIYQKYE